LTQLEDNTVEAQKACATVLELFRKHGGNNPFILRPSAEYKHPTLIELLNRELKLAQAVEGFMRMTPFVPPNIRDPTGDLVENVARIPDPDAFVITFLAKGLKLVKTTEETKTTKTTFEVAPVEREEMKKPRIDFRGRAGPIKHARMKEFAITFEKALQQMSDPNPKYAKGAEMYVRLGFNVKGEELEKERPDLYRRAVERLTAIKPVRI
jgi:hypothetical protein